MDFDLFVIGGGSAGVRCARIAAGHGARVGVAEERFWGGTCVNVGCVPKKLLVQAGEYGAWAEDAAGFGWTIKKGPHDWAKLIAAKDREIGRLNGIYKRLLDNAGATIFEARATFLDPHTLDVGGKRVTAERIVIAPADIRCDCRFPARNSASSPTTRSSCRTCRSAWRSSARATSRWNSPASSPVSAHTWTWCIASRCRCAASTWTCANHWPRRSARRASRCIQGRLPQKITAHGDERVLTFGEGHELRTDLVFFATGRAPATTGLGLDKVGVTLNGAGAVVVDQHLSTSQRHIYAMGDVTDRLNLTPVAIAEGHALADSLFGKNPRAISLRNVPTAVFSTPPIATCGLTEEQAAEHGPVDVYVSKFTPMRHTLSGRARKSTLKLLVDQVSQKVIGAHMLGEDAPEIMQGLAIGIVMGATKADFDRTIGIHPTAAEEFVTLRTRTRVTGMAKAAE